MGSWYKDKNEAVKVGTKKKIGRGKCDFHLWRVSQFDSELNEKNVRFLIGKKIPKNIMELIYAGFTGCEQIDYECIKDMSEWEKEQK